MFTMSDGRVFGHAAASDSILQGNNNCEHCYELTYGGHKMVVKVDNWCPCNSNPVNFFIFTVIVFFFRDA